MRTPEFVNRMKDDQQAEPVPASLLQQMSNEPARSQVKRAQLVTRAARTVLSPRTSDIAALSLNRSELVEGMFELPEGLEIPFGLPGLTGRRLETLPPVAGLARERSLHVAESFIPDTEQLTFNPTAVFGVHDSMADRLRTEAMRKAERTSCCCKDNNRRSELDAEDITIFGNDDRVNIYPNGYPERCICRIEVYTRDTANGPWIFRKRGTGFMAGDRVMLSSGHMSPPTPNAGWMIKVVPGSYDGQSVYGASFFTYASDYVWWYSDAGNDMMACRLYDPIGQTTGYFGATTYKSRWEDQGFWSMCGYPFDRGEWRPTYQGGIPVRDDDDGDDIRLPDGNSYDTTQVESEADRAKGASGSPFYSWFNNGQMYAVGIHHGLEIDWIFPAGEEKWSCASGGAGLPALINWARAAWP